MQNSSHVRWQIGHEQLRTLLANGADSCIQRLAIAAGVLIVLLGWPTSPAAAQEVRVIGSPPGDAVPVVHFAPRGQPDSWQEAQLQGGSYRLVGAEGRVGPGTYFIRVSVPGCGEATVLRFVGAATRVRVRLQCAEEPTGAGEAGEPQPGVQPESDAAPDLGSFPHRVVVSSSRGHQIESASVQLTLGPGFAAQGTAVERTVRYMHEGDGAYAASFNLAALDVGTNSYTLRVEAEDHAPYFRALQSLDSSYDAEAIHNNYYARCNEWGDESGWLGSDPWGECEVDPDRLIETFGTEVQDLDQWDEERLGGSLYIQDFEIYRVHPEIRVSDMKDRDLGDDIRYASQPRRRGYQNAIKAAVKGPALAKAALVHAEIIDMLEDHRASASNPTEAEIAAKASSIVSQFAESLEHLSAGFDISGALLEGARAFSRGRSAGQLDELLHATGYFAAVWPAFEQFKEEAEGTSLAKDKTFQEALVDVEEALLREYNAAPERLAEASGRRELADYVNNLLLGTVAKGGVKAGFTLLSIAGGKGIAVAGGPKALAAVLAWDVMKAARDRRNARVQLGTAAWIDREVLSSYPDSVTPATAAALSPRDRRGALMRLTLGQLFNQTRAAYLAGEHGSWLGNSWRFVLDELSVETERDAYNAAMVRVSVEKAEQAEEGIAQLAAFLADNATYASDDEGDSEAEARASEGASSALLRSLNGTVWANKRNIRGSGAFTQFKGSSITDLIYWNLPYNSGCRIMNSNIVSARGNVLETEAGDGSGKILLYLNNDNLRVTVLEKFSGIDTGKDILFFPEGTEMEFERVDSFPSNIDRCETVFN